MCLPLLQVKGGTGCYPGRSAYTLFWLPMPAPACKLAQAMAGHQYALHQVVVIFLLHGVDQVPRWPGQWRRYPRCQDAHVRGNDRCRADASQSQDRHVAALMKGYDDQSNRVALADSEMRSISSSSLMDHLIQSRQRCGSRPCRCGHRRSQCQCSWNRQRPSWPLKVESAPAWNHSSSWWSQRAFGKPYASLPAGLPRKSSSIISPGRTSSRLFFRFRGAVRWYNGQPS